jgi:muramidase (phage lysozyme)
MADRAFYEQFRNTPEGRALLGVIRYAEGTSKSNDPYRVLFGGSQFSDLSRHPNRVIRTDTFPRGSAAAGAYQFLPGTWNQQSKKLGLQDFGSLSQDIAALDIARYRLRNLGGLSYLKQRGLTREALAALAPEWASLPTMEGRSYYGQPVKSAPELQRVYQQYYSQPGAKPQAAQQTAGKSSQPASAPPQGKQQPPVKRPAPDYFQGLMRGIQNMFGTTGPSRSSNADAYFDAAMQADAMGEKDTAMALYAKAIESDAAPSSGSSGAIGTFASVITPIISEYVTAAMTPAETPSSPAPQATTTPPAATRPNTSGIPAGSPLAVGKVIDPKYDVFPTTGAHLDVRVLKEGEYVNPEFARSMLQNLYVGGKPLYSQKNGAWQAAHPITSGFGPRTAPTAGASTFHRGIDIGVGAGTPLEWRGGGQYRYDKGYGVIETTDPSGRPYTIKLLHTASS